MTDFYLGYDMPQPPLPPSMVTDLRWSAGTEWSTSAQGFKTFDNATTTSFTNGKSVMLDISGDNSNAINISSDIMPSVVYAMCPKGHDYTLNGNGKLTGTMELWKSMNGMLTVNKDLGYTGKTVISEGTLTLNGTLKGSMDLRAKGTLAGNATLNDTTLFEGALNYEGCRLAPGTSDSPYGVITSNKSITLPGNVYIEENLQTEGTVKCDLLKVNGDLTLNGTNTFTIIPAETKMQAGEYTLAACTGTLTADSTKIKVRGLVGLSYHIAVRDKQIVLIINGTRDASTGVSWTGAVNGSWDYQTENFALDEEATTFVANDEVTFGDDATQRVITLTDLMQTNGVNVTNNSGSYAMNGSGGLSGTGSLTKTGTGTLYLNSVKSDYTGATILKGGTTIVAALADADTESSIGAATADASNLQLSGCTLTINNANTATNHGITLADTACINLTSGYNASLKGIITGTGTLVKSGAGQLNLTYGTNTYSGGTIIKGGTLAQGAWNTTFGKLGGNLMLQGGTINMMANNNTSTLPNLQYAVTVADGTTNSINASYRCKIQGSFTGGGTLNLSVPYVRTDISANWSSFTGTLNATGNQLRFVTTTDMSNGTLTLGDGIYMGHFASGSGSAQSLTSKFGALSSSYTTCTVANGTYNVGYNNKEVTFAGILSCTAVNKYGTAIWNLTSTASTAPINVYGGTLRVKNSSGNATTGTITVNSGATLDGNGTVKNVIIQKGGTLAAGVNATSTATLSIGGSLTMNAGSSIICKLRSYSNDKFNITGAVKFNGDTLVINNINRELKDGDELTIFTGTGTRSGSYVIYPATPGNGYAWDDSQLLSDGILKIAATTGVNATTQDKQVDVFDNKGVMMRENVIGKSALEGLQQGVYLIKIHQDESGRIYKVIKRP